MKTKFNLTLLTALFASFAFMSCQQLPDVLTGEFPITVTGGKYSITITPIAYNNAEAKNVGYVRAYVIDEEGNESLVDRANEGDVIWLQASAYEKFDFMQWFASNNVSTLTESESDITNFIMPEGDVEIRVWFDDTTIPMPTAAQFIADNIPVDLALEENVNLRAWKEQQISQTFVWFDAWSGRMNSGQFSMRGLPDEVTLISNWGQPKWNLSSWQKADMQYIQKVKGAKVVFTLFAEKIGADVEVNTLWSGVNAGVVSNTTSTDEAAVRPAIAAYAKQIYLQSYREGYDGFDWDFEPSFGGKGDKDAPLWRIKQQAAWFLEELSFYFGPKAQTYTTAERQYTIPGTSTVIDRRLSADVNKNEGGAANGGPSKRLLLCVDGEVHMATFNFSSTTIPHAGIYVDYYIQQAYGANTMNACSTRINGIIAQQQHNIDAGVITKEQVINRCIMTENFEEASYLDDGNGLTVMAGIKVYEGAVFGGFGAYRIGLSYDQSLVNNETYTSPGWEGENAKYYVWLRKGIDIQYGVAGENGRRPE